MRSGVPLLAVGLLSLAALPVSGLPLVPLEGDLVWSQPARMMGAVTLDAPEGSLSILRPDGAYADEVAKAPSARLVLHRWVSGYMGVQAMPTTGHDQAVSGLPDHATDLSVAWVARVGVPRLLVEDLADGARLDAIRCELARVELDEMATFPFDGSSLEPHTLDERTHPDDLRARCSAGGFVDPTADRLLIFGMELHLTGNAEFGPFKTDIWTGTKKLYETGPTMTGQARDAAVVFYLTQVLEIVPDGAVLRVDVPGDGRATVYGRTFHGAGELTMGTSDGRLRWGPSEVLGHVPPMQADGLFRFHGEPADRVALDGRTAAGPGLASTPTVASGASLVLPGVVAAGAVGLVAVLLVLFHRLTRDDALTHPRRERLVDLVRSHPGILMNAAARQLGVRWNNVWHHVQHLQRHGILTVRRVGPHQALFPPGSSRGREGAVILLQRPVPRRVHDALLARPGLDQFELAEHLGIHRSRVSRVLARLRTASLVGTVEAPGRTRYVALPLDDAPLPTVAPVVAVATA